MRRFFVELWESLLIALRAVSSHKLRAVLTTLGIIIGITSVTAMATVIGGLEQDFEEEMSQIGTDVLYVEKWPWVQGPNFKWWEYVNRPDITPDLAEVIADRSRYVEATTPVATTRRSVRNADASLSGVQVEGSSASYPRVRPVTVEQGRFFNDLEARSARSVAVIGARVAEELFPLGNAVGKDIRVDGRQFQVIGVLEKKGSGAEGSSEDTQVKIPISTFGNLFGMQRRSVSVQLKLNTPDIAEAKDEITGILRVARRLDALEQNNFELNEQDTLRERLAPIKLAIYSIGIFLTALSLLVGGIGVMNIMFVSVKERTREIGIRKAVGAKRWAILMQFLIESIVVCLIGGVIGVLLSAGLAVVISSFLPAYLPLSTVGIAFGICMAIGIIFGLAPAWTAAKAEPIDALRYE